MVLKRTIWRSVALIMVTFWMGQPSWAADGVRCMLDWYPNPDHVPIYAAQSEGFFEKQGVQVDIMVPADPNDPLKLVAAGQVDFAVSYQPSVIMARAEGLPVVSIGALVQHPLSSILSLRSSGINSPADFKGRKIGYSVDPLYRVLFEAVAETAGLKPSDYELYRVGFNLVPPLLTGQTDAVIGAFRNYEAIQIELEGKAVVILPLEENGVPDFYELVIITNERMIQTSPDTVRAFMRGLASGIEWTVSHPQAALEVFLSRHPDLRDDLNRRSFEATLPFFKGSPAQEPARWTALQDFMLKRGLIQTPSPVKKLVWDGKN